MKNCSRKSLPQHSESDLHGSMWSGNKFIYSLFGLFIVVFVAEVDKLIFRAGWISIPGGAIVVYSGVTGAIVLGLMMTAGPKRI